MSYGYDNELKSINSKAVQVDKDGNLLTYTLNGVKYAADYDSQNNLLSFDGINYEYDSEGNRIKVSEGSKETTFVVDTDNPNSKYSQILTEETDGKVKYHIYGNGLIGTHDSESEEDSESFLTNHYDLRGSTVSISDDVGKIVGTVDYDEYGIILHQYESIETRFLYNGQYGVQTDDNGLNYMRNRYYNPEIKRFMNRDVIVGNIEDSQTLNRYAYVNGNPITYNDPFGLARESIVGSSWLSNIQTTLDIAGMIPGLGVFPDVINAGIYLASGNYEEALWSGIGAVPIVGDATSGVRNVNKLNKVVNNGSGIVVQEYKYLKKNEDIVGQAHHLNQDAAYRDFIPHREGMSVKLEGNAFIDVDSPHYLAHESLEKFWDKYRKGGTLADKQPTNKEYGEAVTQSLIYAGYSSTEANSISEIARLQRNSYGLDENKEVPRVPRKLGQKKR